MNSVIHGARHDKFIGNKPQSIQMRFLKIQFYSMMFTQQLLFFK